MCNYGCKFWNTCKWQVFLFDLLLSEPLFHFCQQNGYRKTGKNQVLGTAYFLFMKIIFLLFTFVLKEFSKEFVSVRIWLNPRRQATFWKVNRNIPQTALAQMLVFTMWQRQLQGLGIGCMDPFPTHLWQVVSCHLICLYFCSSFSYGLSSLQIVQETTFNSHSLIVFHTVSPQMQLVTSCGCHVSTSFKTIR